VSGKDSILEIEGVVEELLPASSFRVRVNDHHVVLAVLSGKIRQNKIRILTGDKVSLEVSPYDLTRGRITYRHR